MNIRYSDYTDGDKNMERIAPLGKEIGVLTCAFRHSLATVLITEENIDPKTAQGFCATHRPTSQWISTRTRRTTQSGKLWKNSRLGWCSKFHQFLCLP
jgi:hypothetical protein